MENRKLKIFNLLLPVIGNSLYVIIFWIINFKKIDYPYFDLLYKLLLFGIPQYLIFVLILIIWKGLYNAYRYKFTFPLLYTLFYTLLYFAYAKISHETTSSSEFFLYLLIPLSLAVSVFYTIIMYIIDFIYLKFFTKNEHKE